MNKHEFKAPIDMVKPDRPWPARIKYYYSIDWDANQFRETKVTMIDHNLDVRIHLIRFRRLTRSNDAGRTLPRSAPIVVNYTILCFV